MLLVGLFYRDTSALAVGLVFLIDFCQGRRDLRAVRDAVFLSIPVAVYAGACRLVMGAFPPAGYKRFLATIGGIPEDVPALERLQAWFETVLAVVVPYDGALLQPEYDSTLRLVALGCFGVFVLLANIGRGWLAAAHYRNWYRLRPSLVPLPVWLPNYRQRPVRSTFG